MTSFTKDVVIVGGCGRVGLPLGLAFADAGLLGRALRPSTRDAVDQVARGRDAVRRAGRRRAARAPGRRRTGSTRPPTPPSSREAEHVVVVIGTPVDEHLNPDPQARARRRRGARSTTCATASCSCCAAPSTRASPRMVERLLARLGRDDRRRVLPRAHRRGQGARPSCTSCRRSCRAAPSGAVERADEAVPARSPTSIVQLDARGGRAGQAVHQHVALHQVRRRQPALHDRQRLRPRLRAHPQGARRYDYPRAADMPGAGLRRRAVPVQGHDAAGRVQQQQLHARPRQHDGQRGPAALPRRRGSSSATTCRA